MTIIIIGAGVCGLTAAHALVADGASVVVLEKSRGVGGRLATRRTEHARFDHGAQYYARKPALAAWDERWRAAGLVEDWFTDDAGVTRVRAPAGMTSLAKNLNTGLDVRLSTRAVRLSALGSGWRVTCEDGSDHSGDAVIVTAPVPQALDLLRASDVAFDPPLARVRYAPALVGMYEGIPSSADLAGPRGYRANPGALIGSIADQRAKGLCTEPAWTVTTTEAFARTHFDEPEEIILAAIDDAIRALDQGFTFGRRTLKKWLYAQPLNPAGGGFARIAPGLYLAGDGFTRPSIGGAASSGAAVAAGWRTR